MASLKDIKRQIGAVKQTQKLTKAMNMVAAAKLRTTQGRTESLRAYADEHHRLMEALADESKVFTHSLLEANDRSNKVLVLAFASDRGLCGSFNTNLTSFLDNKILEIREAGDEPHLFLVGRKLNDYYQRRNVKISYSLSGVLNNFDYPLATEMAESLIKEYMNGDLKEVLLLTTRFFSLSRQKPEINRFLPLAHVNKKNESKSALGFGYIVEPDPATLFNRLIPRSLTIMLYQAMLESVTSENAARMQAMDNASQNCKEITENLTQVYNKLRQAAVTNELLDIVNGSEALTAA